MARAVPPRDEGTEIPVDQIDQTRQRLERLHEEFSTEANRMEALAEDALAAAVRLRAQARGLRQAAEGVSDGIASMQKALKDGFADPDLDSEQRKVDIPPFHGSATTREADRMGRPLDTEGRRDGFLAALRAAAERYP